MNLQDVNRISHIVDNLLEDIQGTSENYEQLDESRNKNYG